MIDLKDLNVGDKVYWMGSGPSVSYGHRRIPAIVIEIKDEKRIKLEIKTPFGNITKFVSCTSLTKEA